MSPKIAVAAVMLVACSSFGEGSHETGTEPDGGTDASVIGPDGATGDAGPGGCAALFCASFDGEPFDAEWSGYQSGPQQQIEIGLAPTEEAPRSPRRALRLTLPAANTLYQTHHLKRYIALPAGARTFTYRFSVRVQTPNTRDGTVRVANVEWGRYTTGEPLAVRAYLAGQNLTFRIDKATGGEVQATATRRLEVGRWYAMATTLTFHSPTNATIESFADGVSYESESFTPPLPLQDRVELQIGADYAASAWTPSTVDFDDVSFDAR